VDAAVRADGDTAGVLVLNRGSTGGGMCPFMNAPCRRRVVATASTSGFVATASTSGFIAAASASGFIAAASTSGFVATAGTASSAAASSAAAAAER